MYTIRKLFRFEAAHQLEDAYSEECNTVHGHSYICEVFCRAKELNNGVVIDFKKLKEAVQPMIDNLDHTLIFKGFPYGRSNKHVFLMHTNPTAENIAKMIYDYVKASTNSVWKVRVHETATGWAEYQEN